MKNFKTVCLVILCSLFAGIYAAEHEEGVDLFLKDLQEAFNLSGDLSLTELQKAYEGKENLADFFLKNNLTAPEIMTGLDCLDHKFHERGLRKGFIKRVFSTVSQSVAPLIEDIPAGIIELQDEDKKCLKKMVGLMADFASIKTQEDTIAVTDKLVQHLEKCSNAHRLMTRKGIDRSKDFSDITTFSKDIERNHKEFYDKIIERSAIFAGIYYLAIDAYESKSFGGDVY